MPFSNRSGTGLGGALDSPDGTSHYNIEYSHFTVQGVTIISHNSLLDKIIIAIINLLVSALRCGQHRYHQSNQLRYMQGQLGGAWSSVLVFY